MFRRFIGFCSRIFSSKGFRRGFRILSCVLAVYYLAGLIQYFTEVMNHGISFWTALRFILSFMLTGVGVIHPAISVAIGIAIGFIWYFIRKQKKEETAEPDEKAEESSDAAPEETFIETTHYKFH